MIAISPDAAEISPEALATSYAEAVAARWHGEAVGTAFEEWLEAYWHPEPLPEPTDPPAAVSLLGGMPAVRWHRIEGAVVGFATGRRGCWWIPVGVRPLAA